MTKKYGSGRDTPPRLRLINDETEVEKYKRQGWDPRKTYAENMGFEGVFDRPGEEFDPSGRYENDGAPSRQESRQQRMARNLAAQGRGNDTDIAHLTPGEYVLPPFMQTPEVMAALRQVAAEKNIPFETLIIGSRRNRINPNTGAPEFDVAGEDEDEAPSQQPPYRCEGPEIDGITVTGRPSTIPLQVYDNQRAFFDKFDEPVGRLAKQYDIDPEHLLGLFGFESGWYTDPKAIESNNIFGLNLPRSKQLHPFPSLDAGLEYWGKMYGDQLRGIQRTDDFVNTLHNLRAGAYNSDNPNYSQLVTDNIDTVKVKRPLWQQGR